jgi:hypothetical protein
MVVVSMHNILQGSGIDQGSVQGHPQDAIADHFQNSATLKSGRPSRMGLFKMRRKVPPRRIQAPSVTTDLIEPTGDGSYEAMKKKEIKERFTLF